MRKSVSDRIYLIIGLLLLFAPACEEAFPVIVGGVIGITNGAVGAVGAVKYTEADCKAKKEQLDRCYCYMKISRFVAPPAECVEQWGQK